MHVGAGRYVPALLLSLLLSACGDSPVAGSLAFEGSVQFPVSAFQGRVTVIDRVEVTVEPPGFPARSFSAGIAQPEATATIAVQAPEASDIAFRARVLSNSGALLYSGSRMADVTGHGFRVDIPLARSGAIFAMRPDTVVLGRDGNVLVGVASAENLGVQEYSFHVDSLPYPACDRQQRNICIAVDSVSRAVGSRPLDVTFVVVAANAASLPREPFRVRFTSTVGSLRLVLRPSP